MHKQLLFVLLLFVPLTSLAKGQQLSVKCFPEHNSTQIILCPSSDQVIVSMKIESATTQSIRSVVIGVRTTRATHISLAGMRFVDQVTSKTIPVTLFKSLDTPNVSPPVTLIKAEFKKSVILPQDIEIRLPIYHIDEFILFQLVAFELENGESVKVPVWGTVIEPGTIVPQQPKKPRPKKIPRQGGSRKKYQALNVLYRSQPYAIGFYYID